jgi:CBS domain-containing protein
MKTIERFIKRVVMAGPQEPLASVAHFMEEHHVGAVVIVENHKPVGIVTDRDLALQVVARGVSPQTPVVRVMSTPVQTIYQDEGVFDTTQAMMSAGVRRLPVVDEDGRLVGIVTLDDLLRVLSRELSNLTDGIKPEMETR